jgi:DNA repair exonuclease SbcCD ATPase subunit
LATSFDPPLRRVAIEAFRGFRDRRQFDVAASAVLLAGPNGTGKTSFFDALQWCFLGKIGRLEGFRAKRNVEHIVNQYRLGERAIVEVDLLVRERSFTIRRTGDYSGSTLEFRESGATPLFGGDAENALADALVAGNGLSLEMALSTSGLMQQDVMRAVLEARPADRYRHISTVLGLGALEDFEEAARDVAKEAKAQADAARGERDVALTVLEQARTRLAAAEQRLQALPQVAALRAELQALLRRPPSNLTVDPPLPTAPTSDFRALGATAGNLLDSLQAFSDAWSTAEAVRSTLPDEPSEDELVRASQVLGVAETAVESARASVAAAELRRDTAESAAEDLAKLAALAIPMLSESCPVCGQQIDAAHVEEELRRRANETATVLTVRAEVTQSEIELRAATAEANAARQSVVALDAARGAWAAYQADEERVNFLYQDLVSAPRHIQLHHSSPTDIVRDVTDIIDYLHALRRRALEIVSTLQEASDRGPVDRASSEIVSFTESLTAKSQRLEEVSQREQVLKTLADSAVEARVEVAEQRFRAVQPLVADIFSRLDPHPAFKTIEFELDTYYRRGTTTPLVRDLVEGVAADPLVVFSTSQANIAALSYFLAMGWSAGDRGLPFVMLDDPVQSMDDVNVLGFADLCRHLRTSRQLIISTHERRLARLLERKLAPRSEMYSARVLEFGGWDRSGPAVTERDVETQLLEQPIRVVRTAS